MMILLAAASGQNIFVCPHLPTNKNFSLCPPGLRGESFILDRDDRWFFVTNGVRFWKELNSPFPRITQSAIYATLVF
jgi:hypothetical protein